MQKANWVGKVESGGRKAGRGAALGSALGSPLSAFEKVGLCHNWALGWWWGGAELEAPRVGDWIGRQVARREDLQFGKPETGKTLSRA